MPRLSRGERVLRLSQEDSCAGAIRAPGYLSRAVAHDGIPRPSSPPRLLEAANHFADASRLCEGRGAGSGLGRNVTPGALPEVR